jgi:hypothetical protein
VTSAEETHRLYGVTLSAEILPYPCQSSKNVAKYSSKLIMVKLRTVCRISWIGYIPIWVSTPCYLSMLSDSEQLRRVVQQHNCLWISIWLYRDPRPIGDFVHLGWLTYRGGYPAPDWLASRKRTSRGCITRTDSRSQADSHIRLSECGGEVEECHT